jgi:hypothetical protein
MAYLTDADEIAEHAVQLHYRSFVFYNALRQMELEKSSRIATRQSIFRTPSPGSVVSPNKTLDAARPA